MNYEFSLGLLESLLIYIAALSEALLCEGAMKRTSSLRLCARA